MYSYSEFTHHYTKSAFRYVEPISEDYRVFVNGTEIPVYTCRISKYPFNRVWPGFQRPFEQSETASFVNIVSDEEIMIEVIANRKHEEIYIKPYSKGIEYTDENGKISFALKDNGQFVLECDSYHHCLYIFNSKPIDSPKPEEVTYYFGPGIHFSNKIELKSNESVYVDKDALVFGWIYADDAENIRIFGNGILDGSGEARFCRECYENYTNGNVKFYDCKNLNIEGVLMRNSAIWCVNLFHCFDVTLDNIKVFGQWRYNTDGIDIVNSQDVRIMNSFIHSFDDTITIKGIDRYICTDNKNILVNNCVLWCDWGRCCEIGIETACRTYSNVSFLNCDILRGGTAALDIQNGDCADVFDILFENINVEFNAFDTAEQLQETDEMQYEKADITHIPLLINIDNFSYRTPETAKRWGIPAKGDYEKINAVGRHGTVHDISYKNINVFYDGKLPLNNGKPEIVLNLNSSFEDVVYRNITISNIKVNGVQVKREDTIIKKCDTENLIFD